MIRAGMLQVGCGMLERLLAADPGHRGPRLPCGNGHQAQFAGSRDPLQGVEKDEVDKELGYFLNNAPRMRYHWFRSRGLFTGSGVVEAGCKAVSQRLKQSAMRWAVNGADSIITLRCAQASSQWETICHNRHNQTPAA